MLSGAVGAGKSFMGGHKGLLLNMKYPGNRGLICRKEGKSLVGSTLKTLFEDVIPQEWIVAHNRQDGMITHKTPIPGVYSTISYGGLDKKADQSYPTKIGSTAYGWIFVDEGIELDLGDWDMLTTRLRYKIPGYTAAQNDLMPRQMFTATNPDSPQHWLHKFFFDNKTEAREVFLTTPYENKYLPRDYLKSLEETLVGFRKERLLNGKWVQAEGAIYVDFDMLKHVVDKNSFLIDTTGALSLISYKRIIFGADSNFPKPRAAVMLGVRGDGSVDLIDEFYEERAHVTKLRDWIEGWAEKRKAAVEVFHDPSDPDAIDTLDEGRKISCSKADNKIIPGISEVSRYFANDLIRINRTCVNTIKYLQTYRWKKGAEEEVPEKKDDHLMDALRYALNSTKVGAFHKKTGMPLY